MGAAQTVSLPATGSAGAIGRVLGLPLTSGGNTLMFSGASSASVGVDRITVVR